ncbi:hypothetical protein ACW9YV_11020 [Paraburkholderia strydomiana]
MSKIITDYVEGREITNAKFKVIDKYPGRIVIVVWNVDGAADGDVPDRALWNAIRSAVPDIDDTDLIEYQVEGDATAAKQGNDQNGNIVRIEAYLDAKKSK